MAAAMKKFLKRSSTSVDSIENESQPKKQNPEQKPEPSSVSAAVKTVRKWMKEFNIDLQITIADDDSSIVTEMVCTTCKEFAPKTMSSNFITGVTRIKKETVAYHAKSLIHARAQETKAAKDKQARNQPSGLQKGFNKIDMDNSDKMCKLFITAYYIAINEKPFSDFPGLINLQHGNGVQLGETYHNEKSANVFIENIGGLYHDALLRVIQEADYFSIFCDGSTDRSDKEREEIFVKVLQDFYPKMKYLKIEEPENTKAEGILAAINKAFLEFDMRNYTQKKLLGSVLMGPVSCWVSERG